MEEEARETTSETLRAQRKEEAKEIGQRKIKDSVFTKLFQDKKYLLELFQTLHPEDNEIKEEDLEIRDIQNIILNGVYNDLSFIAKDRFLILVEAQSTWNPNMPTRMLIYFARLLEEFQKKAEKSPFSKQAQKIPKPEFYVVYSGEGHEEITELTLDDLIEDRTEPHLQMKVKVIRQSGQNNILDQYLSFTQILKEQEEIFGKRTLDALESTINICIRKGILTKFLTSARKEIEGFMLDLFNQQNIQEAHDAETMAEGEARGEARGIIKQAVRTITNLLGKGVPFEEALATCEVEEKYEPEVRAHFPQYSKA